MNPAETINKYGEPAELHGPVCSVCSQRIPAGFKNYSGEPNVCRHCGPVTKCFTFGFSHAYPNGFVRITAATEAECREEMVRRYGKQWAFEYSEEQIADQLKRFPWMFEVTE